MLRTIIGLDESLTETLLNLLPHSPFFDRFFTFFSFHGASIIIWLIILFLLVIFEEKRNLRFIIYFLITLFITFFLVNFGLKNIFHRLRPLANFRYIQAPKYSCPTDFSFPSTHAALSFAAAAVLAFYDKKRRWVYYLIAVVVAYSRIYLQCHYFFDVLAGALIGYSIGWLVTKKPKN